MELLLLLTAFLASLTGVGSGDRVARQVQGVAVVHAAEVAQAAVQPAQRVLPAAASAAALRPARTGVAPAVQPPLVARYLPFERRLE